MLLLSGVLIGIVAGLLMGGSVWALGKLRLHHWPLLFAALITEVAIFSSALASSPVVLAYGGIVYSAALAVVLFVLARNLSIPGIELLFLGTLLNTLVIVANGGQMPVDQSKLALLGQSHPAEYRAVFTNTAPMTESTRLAFLADVFVVPEFSPIRNVYSVGDVLLVVGAAMFLVFAMRRPQSAAVDVALS